MISIDSAVLWLLIMVGVGAYFMWRHGDRSYNEGMKDALILLDEGRLRYELYFDDDEDTRMINIEVDPLDEQ